uniref:Uncharacterized protein n=1 Tax=Periophthalmus magnuspinnatus TaxID=409849 RepID=A0A3B4AAA6_9GOBI
MCKQVCAVWEVSLSDGLHRIEFEHGTTTGKRVVYVNGQEVLRRDWMFKLVGSEQFSFGVPQSRAEIRIAAVGGFSYEYSLHVNGLTLQKFTQNRTKTTQTWDLGLDRDRYRIVLERNTMDVWCNGHKMDAEFVEDGTQTRFFMGQREFCLRAEQGKKSITYCLLLDGQRIHHT